MPTIRFEVTLRREPTQPFVVISAGADVNDDARIDDRTELALLQRRPGTLVWTRQLSADKFPAQMRVGVVMNIGKGVDWRFRILDVPGAGVLATRQGTTTEVAEILRLRLP